MLVSWPILSPCLYHPLVFLEIIFLICTLSFMSQGAVMQYGHGLFGSQDELLTDYLVAEADEYGYILAGVNWDGMCKYDEFYVALMVATDFSNFPMIPDR